MRKTIPLQPMPCVLIELNFVLYNDIILTFSRFISFPFSRYLKLQETKLETTIREQNDKNSFAENSFSEIDNAIEGRR